MTVQTGAFPLEEVSCDDEVPPLLDAEVPHFIEHAPQLFLLPWLVVRKIVISQVEVCDMGETKRAAFLQRDVTPFGPRLLDPSWYLQHASAGISRPCAPIAQRNFAGAAVLCDPGGRSSRPPGSCVAYDVREGRINRLCGLDHALPYLHFTHGWILVLPSGQLDLARKFVALAGSQLGIREGVADDEVDLP